MTDPHNSFPGTYDAAALAVMQEAFEAAWEGAIAKRNGRPHCNQDRPGKCHYHPRRRLSW